MDWVALGVIVSVAIVAAGALVGYGVLRQKVADLAGDIMEQGKAIDRLGEALVKATNVGHQVELLQQSTDNGHKLLRQEQSAASSRLDDKLERVAGEVRSFMQGQASMGQGR